MAPDVDYGSSCCARRIIEPSLIAKPLHELGNVRRVDVLGLLARKPFGSGDDDLRIGASLDGCKKELCSGRPWIASSTFRIGLPQFFETIVLWSASDKNSTLLCLSLFSLSGQALC